MLGSGIGLSLMRSTELKHEGRPTLPDVPSVAPFVTAIWGQSEHQHILLESDDVLPKEELVD